MILRASSQPRSGAWLRWAVSHRASRTRRPRSFLPGSSWARLRSACSASTTSNSARPLPAVASSTQGDTLGKEDEAGRFAGLPLTVDGNSSAAATSRRNIRRFVVTSVTSDRVYPMSGRCPPVRGQWVSGRPERAKNRRGAVAAAPFSTPSPSAVSDQCAGDVGASSRPSGGPASLQVLTPLSLKIR